MNIFRPIETTDSLEGLTVEQLAELVKTWPRQDANGNPCRVLVAVAHDEWRAVVASFDVSVEGLGEQHLMLEPDLDQDDPGNDTPNATPIDVALAAFSYLRHTPQEVWEPGYWMHLQRRAIRGLEGIKRAQAGLRPLPPLPPVSPVPAAAAGRGDARKRLQLHAALGQACRVLIRPIPGFGAWLRLRLAVATFCELRRQ